MMDDAELLAVIADHARNPAPLQAELPSGARELGRETRTNPTCGDRVELAVHLVDDRVFLRGTIAGCALSTAAGVILAEALEGAPRELAVEAVANVAEKRLRGKQVQDELLPGHLGDRSASVLSEELAGVAGLEVVPLRRRCIAFSWTLASDLLRTGEEVDPG